MDTPRQGNSFGHSADVRMYLYVNGDTLKISHLGPEYIILRTPIEHDPIDAEISLSIDGNERRWAVRLVNGIRADCPRTAIEASAASGRSERSETKSSPQCSLPSSNSIGSSLTAETI